MKQFYQPLICLAVVCLLSLNNVVAQQHPVLITQQELDALAANVTERNALLTYCDTRLNTLIIPDYAGWEWRFAIERYCKAYHILKQSEPVRANTYAKKALALMKTIARHHNMGGPPNHYEHATNTQFIGLADGVQTTFTLPFTPLPGSTVQVIIGNTEEIAYTYSSPKVSAGRFQPIIKISNTPGGTNDYAKTDYRLAFRDGYDVWRLLWLTDNHPAQGSTYYVTYYVGNHQSFVTLPQSGFTVSGTTVTLTAAPLENKAVFVRAISSEYEQTGNHMGGVNSVQPDGPGYQMRTFNVGLAFGFDLLYDYPEFTPALKEEFVNVLNEQINWYEGYGYERDGDLGNYFIRGLYTGTIFTAYGTEGANPRAAELKAKSEVYTNRIFNKLALKLPSGFGPQGQYANGTITDVIQTFLIYKSLTGEDLLSQLEWTDNTIPAVIHGTKPDRRTFYDGGDWSNFPATPLVDGIRSFVQYLPQHQNAAYARQLLLDAGAANIPPGQVTDYKATFPLAYCGKISGPVYTRSSWATDAVWASLVAGEIFMDHIHFDQGHITIQKGADYLLVDAGRYGDMQTDPWHNTVLIDDRGAGNISTYPPGQGRWGFARNRIVRFENTEAYTYSAADITSAYARHHDGVQNSVALAFRTFLFIRPNLVIVHDKLKTPNLNVKKIFNCNFATQPVLTMNGVYAVAKGASKLFYKPVVPSNAELLFTPITGRRDVNNVNTKITVSGQINSTFLNAFEAVPSSTETMTPVQYIDIQTMEGVESSDGSATWIALFAKTDTVLTTNVITYAFTTSGVHNHIIADVEKGKQYEVTIVNNEGEPESQLVTSSSQGTLHFNFNASSVGTVLINKTGAVARAGLLANITTKAYVENSQLTITWYSQKSTRISCSVVDIISGKTLEKFSYDVSRGDNHFTHDLQQLPVGIYSIRITDNKKSYAIKISNLR
jgi:hypothetical protein